MQPAARNWQSRLPALLALALPVAAGIASMEVGGAPRSYSVTNFCAIALAAMWILFGGTPRSRNANHAIMAVAAALLFVPLITGPDVNGIARWLPAGPFILHAGMLCVPVLALLAARNRQYAAPLLLAALLAALLQPDAATGLALVFGAAGLYHASQDWRVGVVTAIGFFGVLSMAVRGELPPQPFVERVIVDELFANPALGVAMAAALLGSFLLILFASPLERPARFACAGSLAGFSVMAIIANYPTPLVGYGAAPILGYGLALGLLQDREI